MKNSQKNCKNGQSIDVIYSSATNSNLERDRNVYTQSVDLGIEEEINQENSEHDESVVFMNKFFHNEEYDDTKKLNENNPYQNCNQRVHSNSTGSCSTFNHSNFAQMIAQPSLAAYRNTISLCDNNSCIVTNNKKSISNSQWTSVCRICHGGESVANLFSPCNCRGSIARTHLQCLERWLKESANSRCELCQFHFDIIRNPRYGVLRSIFVFLLHPGDHLRELLLDLLAFLVYTPATVASTYMLMLLCESITKSSSYQGRSSTLHVMTLAAVFGMAAIDFTYSSWLTANFHKHIVAWRNWYRFHCDIKLVLPDEQSKSTQIGDSLENEVD